MRQSVYPSAIIVLVELQCSVVDDIEESWEAGDHSFSGHTVHVDVELEERLRD